MSIQGFQIVFSGYNFNPDRNEVTAMMKKEVELHAYGFTHEWKQKTFAEKCKAVGLLKGANKFYVDAVRGCYFGN